MPPNLGFDRWPRRSADGTPTCAHHQVDTERQHAAWRVRDTAVVVVRTTMSSINPIGCSRLAFSNLESETSPSGASWCSPSPPSPRPTCLSDPTLLLSHPSSPPCCCPLAAAGVIAREAVRLGGETSCLSSKAPVVSTLASSGDIGLGPKRARVSTT